MARVSLKLALLIGNLLYAFRVRLHCYLLLLLTQLTAPKEFSQLLHGMPSVCTSIRLHLDEAIVAH